MPHEEVLALVVSLLLLTFANDSLLTPDRAEAVGVDDYRLAAMG